MNSTTLAENLYRNIDKISKVALLRIEKHQDSTVINMLKDLEKIIFSFFRLKTEKTKTFIDRFCSQNINSDNSVQIQEIENTFISKISEIYISIYNHAINNKSSNIANKTINSFNNITKRYLIDFKKNQSKNSDKSLHLFLFFYQQIGQITNSNTQNLRHSFYWFFEIVFDNEFDNQHVFEFQKALFYTLTSIIDQNKASLITIKEFLNTSIHGNWNPNSYQIHEIGFNESLKLKEKHLRYLDKKNELSTLISNAYTQNEYKNVIVNFNKFIEIINDLNLKETGLANAIILDHKLFIEQRFKYNILKITTIFIGAYCLYKNRHDLIEEILFYNQPKDSTASWANEDINPLNINDIIALNAQSFNNNENYYIFALDGHHEFSTYYNQYIAILLVNAVHQNKRTNENWRNEVYITNKSPNELELFLQSINQLSLQINYFKPKSNEETKFGLPLISFDNTLSYISTIKKKIKIQIQEIKTSSSIDPVKAQIFINSFIEEYKNNGIYRRIIKQYTPIDENIGNFSNCKNDPIEIKRLTIKSLFAKNDSGTYSGASSSFAKIAIFYENHFLKKTYINHKDCIKNTTNINNLITEINNIPHIEEKILIFSNIDPMYDIFISNSDFNSAYTIIDREKIPEINEFSGFYKKSADVYCYNDDSNIKKLLIIDKNKTGKLTYFYPKHNKVAIEKMHDKFWFDIVDLNRDKNARSELIVSRNYDAISLADNLEEQHKALKMHVLLTISYKIDLELPKDFKCWFYEIDN